MRPSIAAAIAIAIAIAAPPALACGQRVHVEMARRAADELLARSGAIVPGIERLFEEREVRAAFYCGAMFPDFGYDGIDPEAAEHTHWRAYQEAHFEVVRARLGGRGAAEWTREDRRRIAFFLGVVSHGVTDNPWHFSSRERPSFLAEAKARDGADHGPTEVAGDLLLHADAARLVRIERGEWYWPRDDILEALRRSGSATTRGKLGRGCLRIETTWHAAALAGPLAGGILRARRPWIAAHLDDHAFGGIAHGAAATAHWARYYYARFVGLHLFQDTPEYGRAGAEHVYTYAGCRDGAGAGTPVLELGGARRIEIAFAVSAIPAGARVARATLWLHSLGGGGPEGETVAEARLAGGGATVRALSTARLTGEPGWVGFDVTAGFDRALVISAPDAPALYRFDSSAAFDEPGRADGLGGGVRVAYRPILVVEPDRGDR